MKYLKKFDNITHDITGLDGELNYDFLEDCFSELIDMNICRLKRYKINEKDAFSISIKYKEFIIKNKIGRFENNSILEDEIKSINKPLEILKTIQDCIYRPLQTGYSIRTSKIEDNVDENGSYAGDRCVIVGYILLEFIKK